MLDLKSSLLRVLESLSFHGPCPLMREKWWRNISTKTMLFQKGIHSRLKLRKAQLFLPLYPTANEKMYKCGEPKHMLLERDTKPQMLFGTQMPISPLPFPTNL